MRAFCGRDAWTVAGKTSRTLDLISYASYKRADVLEPPL
jgi:hypothetical protein